MKLMACAVAAMSVLGGAAHAGEWRLVTVDDQSALYLDTSTVRNLPYSQKKVAWVASVLPATANGVDYHMVQYEFDCAAMSSAGLSIYSYGVNEEVVNSATTRQASRPVIPDTRGHDMYRAVCEGVDEPASSSVRDALDIYRRALASED